MTLRHEVQDADIHFPEIVARFKAFFPEERLPWYATTSRLLNSRNSQVYYGYPIGCVTVESVDLLPDAEESGLYEIEMMFLGAQSEIPKEFSLDYQQSFTLVEMISFRDVFKKGRYKDESLVHTRIFEPLP